MGFTTIPTLRVEDLFDFFKLFDGSRIDSIRATLFNGTHSRRIELLPDVFLITEEHLIIADTIDDFKLGLTHVTHNQIQNCNFVVNDDIFVFISLLKSEINITASDVYNLKELKIFCDEKDVRKLTIDLRI